MIIDDSPNQGGRHDKRKHDDLSSEEDSDDSETLDDLQDDLEDYVSEEDPDYKVVKHISSPTSIYTIQPSFRNSVFYLFIHCIRL